MSLYIFFLFYRPQLINKESKITIEMKLDDTSHKKKKLFCKKELWKNSTRKYKPLF